MEDAPLKMRRNTQSDVKKKTHQDQTVLKLYNIVSIKVLVNATLKASVFCVT